MPMRTGVLASVWVFLACVLPRVGNAGNSQGWITHPDRPAAPVVLVFQREFNLPRVPATLPADITADNRYILYVNRRPVARGPSTGTLNRWRVRRVDLAPFLRRGPNELRAVVWNFGDWAPFAQQSLATGFRLSGPEFGTEAPGWTVAVDATRSAADGAALMRPEYYVASTPEIFDARRALGEFREAVPAPEAAARTLIADPLPAQLEQDVPAGEVVRASLDAKEFPARALTIPAHSSAYLLLRRDAMVSGYPELRVAGGRDAQVKLTYAEALYDAVGGKGDRNAVEGREIRGIHDLFITDGAEQSFEPLWWRTWRYLQLDITTAAEPLQLRGLRVRETGYPFTQIGRFESDDIELNRIFDIGWRTLRVDAHETFMDSSYWEQLQYAGDTRLEMLISYAVAGDPRLALQAIDAFADSNLEGGIMNGAYPSRSRNVITTFSLAWVAMLHDWWWHQPDTEPLRRHLPRMREVLAWFEKLRTPSGLLGANPHWNFIDWSGQSWDDRTVFPSYGRAGGSCLMTVLWLGALRQAADLENAVGEPTRARGNAEQADAAREAIRAQCWDARHGLFADNPDFAAPDRAVYSQHMNALAVLYGVASPPEAPRILERVTLPGQGIRAPDGMFAMTYYFSWYLVRAFEKAGLADRYQGLLQSWRELLPLNFTTWPESPGKTRSDTHAWTAHPTADLLGVVAGIQPGAPGYARVRIEPHLGALTRLDATAATPRGPVTVRYRLAKDKLRVIIQTPPGLTGEFIWKGRAQTIAGTHMRFTLDASH